jgi:hypothetical protein
MRTTVEKLELAIGGICLLAMTLSCILLALLGWGNGFVLAIVAIGLTGPGLILHTLWPNIKSHGGKHVSR